MELFTFIMAYKVLGLLETLKNYLNKIVINKTLFLLLMLMRES